MSTLPKKPVRILLLLCVAIGCVHCGIFISELSNKLALIAIPLIFVGVVIFNIAIFQAFFFNKALNLSTTYNIKHVYFMIMFFGMMVFVPFFYSLQYETIFEHNQASFRIDDPMVDGFDFYYFSTSTFATVGYGDIVPKSSISRFLAVLEMFNGIVILILMIANIDLIKSVILNKQEADDLCNGVH